MKHISQSRTRLTLDLDALSANFQRLSALAPTATCGAAVKADCYGIGLEAPVQRLWKEGCRDFFVATLEEGCAVRSLLPHASIHVLNGIMPDDISACLSLNLIPVLNTPDQILLWRATGAPSKPCNIMIDTGINRQGIGYKEAATLSFSGLKIDIIMSHLACADEPEHPHNMLQRARFAQFADSVPAQRRSFANSAGIALGEAYHYDLTRPGISLYGGAAHPCLINKIAPVARLEAQILQIRTLEVGESVGYGATWTATKPTPVATLSVGYADGYLRSFSNYGWVVAGGVRCPVIGRVSMDLITIDIQQAPPLKVGDWATLLGNGITLAEAADWSGLSQYELLTTLGHRYERIYI